MTPFANDIYAGVLGKLLGVYFGRPVEGWTYEKIMNRFGEIHYYKNSYTGAPLIVPDDDISGTFAFYRALEDNGYSENITAKQIGDSWLNYIIENKTILWWGGLSRSTEHTAYLRLKNGIEAPYSGSVELNGRSMAEQIGSQIFIDTWAMVNPNNPALAAKMAKEAASVSHGGIAIDAAVYLAVMESMAFTEKDVNTLLDRGLDYVESDLLRSLIADIREQCAKTDDWHQVRQWIADNHGYERYPGNCPMVTNHLVVLMAILMAGDDFEKSISIASTAGWDTDCNAGNVGAFNGIRLGLAGIDAGTDLRRAVADRMYICTSDGGSCVTDAVTQAHLITRGVAALQGEELPAMPPRFNFAFDGSVQGFIPYPDCVVEQVLQKASHNLEHLGLEIAYEKLGRGVEASVSVDTFVDMKPKGVDGTSYFDVITSPSLYATQMVNATVYCQDQTIPTLQFFIDCYDGEDQLVHLRSDGYTLSSGDTDLTWEVPDTLGRPIYRMGIVLTSQVATTGSVILKSMDWSGAPRKFAMGGSMEMTPSLTPWTTQTTWLKSFVSSAENFCPDYTTTFSVSHPVENGVATIGTLDWTDYKVSSTLTLAQQNSTGLVARACGHRRYYAAVLKEGCAVICKRENAVVTDLMRVPYPYKIDSVYALTFTLKGSQLSFAIDGKQVVTVEDTSYRAGGAGFVVDGGAMLADTFVVEAV